MRAVTGIITGGWNSTKCFCGNEHEELTEMTLETKGKTLSYVCPHCKNELDLSSFEKMLGHMHDEIIEGQVNDILVNLTHHKWKDRKKVQYKVLRHDREILEVSVLNLPAIRKQ